MEENRYLEWFINLGIMFDWKPCRYDAQRENQNMIPCPLVHVYFPDFVNFFQSIEAAELTFLFDKNIPSFDSALIMCFILDERNTYADFLNQFNSLAIEENLIHRISIDYDNYETMELSQKQFIIEEKWSENLGKCIDGTPIHHDG